MYNVIKHGRRGVAVWLFVLFEGWEKMMSLLNDWVYTHDL